MPDKKDDKPSEERRQGPTDRRVVDSDRRDSDRVINEESPRRQDPDRRHDED